MSTVDVPPSAETEPDSTASPASERPLVCADPRRLRAIFDAHYTFVWRSLRRLGIHPNHVDDAAQRVFIVVARKIENIVAGSERSYLFGTAYRIASDARDSASRNREIAADGAAFEQHESGAPSPEELLDQKRRRALLDTVLDGMEFDLRTVFVLFELEGLTMSEISALLEIPPGTVASRLRRAREDFFRRAEKMQARLGNAGRTR